MKFNKFNLVSFIIEAAITSKAFAQSQYRPVVIWHGMGDTCCNEASIGGFMENLKELLPDTFIYSLNVSDSESELVERKNSYFGNVNEHVDFVCNKLRESDIYPHLKNGFNALGFSQGGQFLRAYVERCNDPPVYNLITYGAQHNGISSIPGCDNDDSGFCSRMKFLVSTNVYSSFVQNNVIQAQYFKSVENYEEYLERSIFLADINNEREEKDPVYKENMLSLNKFVMIRFEDDDVVIPPSTSWFGWIDDFDELIPFNKTETYKEDWLGLKTMEKQNKLEFLTAPGNHMQVNLDYFVENVFHPFLDEVIDNDNNDDNNNDDDNDDNDDDTDDEYFRTKNNVKSKNNDDYLNSFFFKIQN